MNRPHPRAYEREQHKSLGWAHRLGDARDIRKSYRPQKWADRFNQRMDKETSQ